MIALDRQDQTGGLRWHQALAWAVTGRDQPELARQAAPDLPALAEHLAAAPGGRRGIEETIAARRASGAAWPIAVPAELMVGLGAAQFAAALADLCRRLLDDRTVRPVLRSRAPDAAERRLLAEVPPHHGV